MNMMIAMGRCFGCRETFMFDADLVPSVWVSLTGDGKVKEAKPYAPGAHQEVICPACAARINPQRRANGLEPIPENDTAEDLIHRQP